MEIEFYLQGVPRWDGTTQVREFYSFVSEAKRTDVNGNETPVINRLGMVDNDIRIQHAAAYSVFAKLVADHKEAAYALAESLPGERVYPADFVPALAEAIEESESNVPSSEEVPV